MAITSVVGEVFAVNREAGNTEDQFTVAVLKDDIIVGHMPHEYSKLCWNFPRHNGREITSRRKRSSIEVFSESLTIYAQLLYTLI